MGILAATVAPQAITVVTSDGNTVSITALSHRNYDEIREAIKVRNYDEAQKLLDLAGEMAARFSSVAGSVKIQHGLLYFGDRPVNGVLGDRAVQMHKEGFDMSPMFKFVENLYQNPSRRAVNELYGFLEATDLPITDDGCFLAYKMVRDDYKSHYDGKTDNSIGVHVSIQRNQVDEDADRTCSYGLHFCSQGYLGSYASHGRVVILKINPRDVVSIPTDYNNSKGRACAYDVVGEFNNKPTTTHRWGQSVADASMVKTGVAAPKPASDEGKKLDSNGRWRDCYGYFTTPPVNPVATKTVPVSRKYEFSGGVMVMIDNKFLVGDNLYKRTVADHVGVDIVTVIDACEDGDIKSVVSSNGHNLVVWETTTARTLSKLDEIW